MSGTVEEERGVRIAVEGCGHGTLHSIYASLEESCRARGWDNADLLIIGGDFQAVRNAYDLNVTAMPHKYRRMADFHEYYSGKRVAPCLTIFIGGNHEASNHLFELYYGGWVAPNIYYLGAANIVRLGPLRIAGLSGIWKGYDYRRPHFERLPYNDSDIHSIFHVRELDVRKLLSVRSQVDIGLSHDWPQGVEWRGNYQWLFRKKDRFEADANVKKLGSVAAAECLDRLRPSHWFSAHLHIKYPAVIDHTQPGGVSARPSSSHARPHSTQNYNNGFREPTSTSVGSERLSPQDRPQVSAWNNFHVEAREEAAKERDERQQELQERLEEEARTGVRSLPQYTILETFKKVEPTESRSLLSTTKPSPTPEEGEEEGNIPNLDGCGFSSLKRRRGTSSPDTLGHDDKTHVPNQDAQHSGPMISNVDGAGASSAPAPDKVVDNPDAIEMDLDSDSATEEPANEDSTKIAMTVPTWSKSSTNHSNDASRRDTAPPYEGTTMQQRSTPIAVPTTQPFTTQDGHVNRDISRSAFSDDPEPNGGVELNPLASSFAPTASLSSLRDRNSEDMNPLAQSFTPRSSISSTRKLLNGEISANADTFIPDTHDLGPLGAASIPAAENPAHNNQPLEAERNAENEVSEEARAKLFALNPSFASQPTKKSAALPFPDAITNKTTNFLALDKCEPNREFLQLLEINSISDASSPSTNRSFKLQYDPEWLAILRVFAPELSLKGDPKEFIAPHRGDTFYRDRIVQEEEWVKNHIVSRDLLTIPEDFTLTSPIYDPQLQTTSEEMPREHTNPQTSAFCHLIGIENKFDFSEEERDARMARGPRHDDSGHGFRGTQRRGGGRGRGGRGGGSNFGRGGGGGGGGGRRGGRGRGRGGSW